MPGSATAEVYFITAMMVLSLVISVTAVFFFARTFRRERLEKEARKRSAENSVAADQREKAAAGSDR
jgi:hypothetical protein